MGKMVWMAMRGGRGASVLQCRPRVKGVGLSVEGGMVMGSNSSYGKGGKEDSKITQM